MKARHTGLDKPRALQRVLYRAAKEDAHRRFHSLYDKVARSDVLVMGWERVRANRGAPGVDGVSIADVEASGVDRFLGELAEALRSGWYRPRPLRRVHIPKAGTTTKTRPLSLIRSWLQAWSARSVSGAAVPRTTRWRRSGWLSTRRPEGTGCSTRIWPAVSTTSVTARSWSRSPDACTTGGCVALHVLDVVWQQHGRRLGVLVRYAVDFIIVCPTVTARDLAARTLATVGLSFNPDKTRVVDLRMGKHGFAFLGFHFRKVESHRWRGRWYCQRWPSTNAMASVPAKIRAETTRAFVGHSLDDRVEVLNPILRGWGNYFAVGNSARAFKTIDRYVFERLALFTSKKHSRRGRRWQAQHNWSWYSRLDIHQLSGRVAWNAPHASR
jgi:Group II intron, maturase-specific domain